MTPRTANQGLGFELLRASFAEALSSLLASREESRWRDYTFDFAEEGQESLIKVKRFIVLLRVGVIRAPNWRIGM